MSSNKLIIAAAGSGKTRKLIHEALKIKKQNVLITTFTEANESGIKNRIIKKTGGYIPRNITIQTWFSFLLQHGVRPYQSVMHEDLWNKKISFYLVSGSSSIKRDSAGNIYSLSEEKQFFQYYFTSKKNLKMHSDKVAEFTCKCNEKMNGAVIKRMSKVYPYIFIDEVQDLAGYDLNILELLFNSQSNILLVGDPRQGTYSTHNSRKNKKFGRSQIIHFFESEDIKKNLEIDDTSLTTNFRSNQKICTFSDKLYPNQKPTNSGQKKTTNHDGIFLVKKNMVDNYLKKFPKCMQLRWDVRKKVNCNYPVMNFGESKGLDFERVLIYPTGIIESWIKDGDIELPPTSCSKFYVAITRALYSVGIVYDFKINEKFEGIENYTQ